MMSATISSRECVTLKDSYSYVQMMIFDGLKKDQLAHDEGHAERICGIDDDS